MIVVGIDSASTTGFAVVSREAGRERLVEHGAVDGRDHLVRSSLARRLRPDIVVIEDAFLGENPKTMKLLSRIQGGWEQAVLAAGARRVEYVYPHSWQDGILRGLVPARGAKREQLKKAAQTWCLQWFGVRVGEDEADAIVLATWFGRQLAVRRAA